MSTIKESIETSNTWIKEHKPLVYAGLGLLGSALLTAYLFQKPTQKLELSGNITLIQSNPGTPGVTGLVPSATQIQPTTGSYKQFWEGGEVPIPHYQEANGLKLPHTRFEQTPQLTGENYKELWQSGDFTVRGTTSEGLIVDKHTLWTEHDSGFTDIKRQQYLIHLPNDQLTRLRSVIQHWRLDDVLKPISSQEGRIWFVHRLTGESFTGSLVDIGASPTFWQMYIDR